MALKWPIVPLYVALFKPNRHPNIDNKASLIYNTTNLLIKVILGIIDMRTRIERPDAKGRIASN